MAIRVILADDHQIFREGLRRILAAEGGIEIVAEAENGRDAVALAAANRPDIIIMDIGMALTNGVEATRRITAVDHCRVVVLSIYDDEETVSEAIAAGAKGYVLKKDGGRDLVDALQAVHRGGVFLSPSLPERLRVALLTHQAGNGPINSRLNSLSPRQREVLQLIVEGNTNKRIAEILDVAVETVKSHRKNLMRTLNIRTVARLTRFAIQAGLVKQPPKR